MGKGGQGDRPFNSIQFNWMEKKGSYGEKDGNGKGSEKDELDC